MFNRRKKFKPLNVEVIDRGEVISSYSTTADSDLEPGMITGSLRRFTMADVVLLRNGEKLTVMKSRYGVDDIIARIKG